MYLTDKQMWTTFLAMNEYSFQMGKLGILGYYTNKAMYAKAMEDLG